MGEVNPRIEAELGLLRSNFPDLDYLPDGHWVRLGEWMVPGDVWGQSVVEVCFQMPERLPGQGPYGFYVRPGVTLTSGQAIANYAYPASTGFGDGWGKFSWQLEQWAPTDDLVAGTNMTNFVRSFQDRFSEGA